MQILTKYCVYWLYICATYSKKREWDGWAHKPGLIHPSPVHCLWPFIKAESKMWTLS